VGPQPAEPIAEADMPMVQPIPLVSTILNTLKRPLVDYPADMDEDEEDMLSSKRPIKSQPKITFALKKGPDSDTEMETEQQFKKARN
jgi:hypothetical protein